MLKPEGYLPKQISNRLTVPYDLAWLTEHVLGKTVAESVFGKYRNEIHTKSKLTNALEHAERFVEIPRVKNLSQSDFKRNFLRKGLPVIMDGAASNWECVKKWTPEWIAKTYGDDPVTLIDASPESFEDVNYVPEQTNLRAVMQAMIEGDTSKYSRFNRILYDHPELTDDFDVKWLSARRNLLSSGKTFQVFMGAKGTRTHLHAASEHNLFVQVYGTKKWFIYPPEFDGLLSPPVKRTPYFHSEFNPEAQDYRLYPGMEGRVGYTCELRPGDVFFNPPSWWHHVVNTDCSIGVGFRWFGIVDSFKVDFMQALLTILATNPSIFTATRLRTDFPKIFSKMNKKQKTSLEVKQIHQ